MGVLWYHFFCRKFAIIITVGKSRQDGGGLCREFQLLLYNSISTQHAQLPPLPRITRFCPISHISLLSQGWEILSFICSSNHKCLSLLWLHSKKMAKQLFLTHPVQTLWSKTRLQILITSWCCFHWLKNWPPEGATCISWKLVLQEVQHTKLQIWPPSGAPCTILWIKIFWNFLVEWKRDS